MKHVSKNGQSDDVGCDRPAPMRNPDNCCYMNACIQLLCLIRGIIDAIDETTITECKKWFDNEINAARENRKTAAKSLAQIDEKLKTASKKQKSKLIKNKKTQTTQHRLWNDTVQLIKHRRKYVDLFDQILQGIKQAAVGSKKYNMVDLTDVHRKVSFLNDPTSVSSKLRNGRQNDATEFIFKTIDFSQLFQLKFNRLSKVIDQVKYSGDKCNHKKLSVPEDHIIYGLHFLDGDSKSQSETESDDSESDDDVENKNKHDSGDNDNKTPCVQDLIDFQLQTEYLTGKNKWFCDECGKKVDASKTHRLVCNTRYALFSLGRFDKGTKNESLVDLSKPIKLHNSVLRSKKSFSLVAALKHSGKGYVNNFECGGHYTTDVIRSDGHGYNTNDQLITRYINRNSFFQSSKTAYILLYERQ